MDALYNKYGIVEKAARKYAPYDQGSEGWQQVVDAIWRRLENKPELQVHPNLDALIYKNAKWARQDIDRKSRSSVGETGNTSMDENDARLEDKTVGPEDQLLIKDLLEKALQTLTPTEQRVWMRRKWEGWTYAEIACSEGKTRATVRKTVERAKKKLQAFVKKEGSQK